MPKRPEVLPPPRSLQPPDSNGRVRVYLDIKQNLSTGLVVLAAKRGVTKRLFLESLVTDAVAGDPDVARMCGVTPRAIK